jgi:hypothetical protein
MVHTGEDMKEGHALMRGSHKDFSNDGRLPPSVT